MESLFSYGSDEDNDNVLLQKQLETKAEQDVNYDPITMEMSEDSTSNHERTSSRSVSVDSTGSTSSQGVKISKGEIDSHNKRGTVTSRSVRSRSRSHDRPRSRDRSHDRRRKYGRDDRDKDKERGRDRDDRSRHRRSRSPSYRHDRFRRSRSPRDRNKYSRKDHSPHSQRRHRDKRDRSPRRNCFERKPSKLSILEKLGIELKMPEGVEKDCTGLPSYYNPVAMNPVKYAEQMAKRKLLWSNSNKQNKEGSVELKEGNNSKGNLWQGATFSQDQDGKMTAKFQRLMGIKQAQQGESSSSTSEGKTGKDLIKKQEELFSSMELQYEVARAATHTQRGVGLGFGVHHYPR